MHAGTLNKRATFQSLTSTPDGAGGSTIAWLTYTTVWAQLSPERAREKIQQGRIADNQAGVLRIRSSSTTREIDDTYRVVVNGTIYNIRSHANPDQRNDMLEMIVETDGTQFVAAGPSGIAIRSAIAASAGLLVALQQTNQLRASILCSAAFAGDVRPGTALAAGVAGTINFAGGFNQAGSRLSAAITGSLSFSGDVRPSAALSAGIGGSISFAADLNRVGANLSAGIVGSTAFTGNLKQTNLLGAHNTGTVNFSGVILQSHAIGAAIVVGPNFAGTITQSHAMGAAIAGASNFSGRVLQTHAMRGAMSASIAMAGDILSTESDWDFSAEYLTSF